MRMGVSILIVGLAWIVGCEAETTYTGDERLFVRPKTTIPLAGEGDMPAAAASQTPASLPVPVVLPPGGAAAGQDAPLDARLAGMGSLSLDLGATAPVDLARTQLPEPKATDPAQVEYQQHLARGVAALERRQAAEAITALNEAIAMRPTAQEPYLYRALARTQQNEPIQAIADLDMAMQLGPSTATLHLNRANLHLRLNQNSEAASDFGQAIKMDPNSIDGYIGSATANLNLRRLRPAIQDASEVIRRRPDAPYPYFLRCVGLLGLGERAAAKADFEEAVRKGLDPDLASHWQQYFAQ